MSAPPPTVDQLRQTLLQHLNTARLLEVLPRSSTQGILTLEHNQHIGEALRALAKKKILSAPLVVAPALEDLESDDPPEGPSLMGWVDIPDVVRGLLTHLRDKHKRVPTNMLLLMTELESEGRLFAHKPLITLSGGEDRSLIYSSEASSTLMQTIKEQFLGGSSGGRVMHRIAIFDDHGTITTIVSQLDIIRHLCARSEQLLGPLAHMPIRELGLPYSRSPLVSVDPNVPTLIAFDHMLGVGVSGAPVVTAKGDMVANLSVSDLRCIQPEHLGVLALPVAEFLALLHRTTYLGYSQSGSSSKDHAFFAGSGSPKPRTSVMEPEARGPASPGRNPFTGELGTDDDVRLITVRPTSTLNEVLHMLGDNHIHRVYVLDPAAPPGAQLQGVITPTDVLRWAVGMPPPPPVPLPRKASGTSSVSSLNNVSSPRNSSEVMVS